MSDTTGHDLSKELNRQMRSIARRSRTVAEIRQRLCDKDYTAEEIEEIIASLLQFKFLDDSRYAEEYVRSRSSMGYGSYRIRLELSNKGCPEPTVDTALAEYEQEVPQSELLKEVIDRRIRIKGEPRDQKTLKQLFDYCARRGFDQELIRGKLSIWFDRVMGG